VGTYGKTIVYICDIDYPFTGQFRAEDAPFIALPSRSREPTNEAALRRAAAEAIHEAVHVFNYSKRPFAEAFSAKWQWFDEALAIYLESYVLPGNHDYFRYMANWVDWLGIPMNDWAVEYQACFFVQYLGPELANQVWMESEEHETPLQALQRLAPAKRGLEFAHPDKQDLFASGYSMDCYFLRDHASVCFSPELCSRFGDRAVVASGSISRDAPALIFEGKLAHLACNYFRVYPHRGVDRLRIVMRPGAGSQTKLKAEVAIAYPDFHRGKVTTLLAGPAAHSDGSRSAEIDDLPSHDLNHVVIVVTNCHLEDATGTYLSESFQIEVTAH